MIRDGAAKHRKRYAFQLSDAQDSAVNLQKNVFSSHRRDKLSFEKNAQSITLKIEDLDIQRTSQNIPLRQEGNH
jgi:hypothetical protein